MDTVKPNSNNPTTTNDSLSEEINARLRRSTSTLAAPDEYYETDHDAHHFFRVTVTIASTTFDAHVMVSHDGMFRVMDRNTCQVSHTLFLADVDIIHYKTNRKEDTVDAPARHVLSVQFQDNFLIDLTFETSIAQTYFCRSVVKLRSAGTRKPTISSIVVDGAPEAILFNQDEEDAVKNDDSDKDEGDNDNDSDNNSDNDNTTTNNSLPIMTRN